MTLRLSDRICPETWTFGRGRRTSVRVNTPPPDGAGSWSAREGEYIVKILTGDLRIGLREGLVEEAISRAFDVSLEEVKRANMLLGDIGQTAVLASRKELHNAELSMFRPIKCMLATPEPTRRCRLEPFY